MRNAAEQINNNDMAILLQVNLFADTEYETVGETDYFSLTQS